MLPQTLRCINGAETVQKLLTDKTIQNLKATSQTYVWDSQLRGFGIRVGPNRRASVVVRNGKRKTLGLYPFISLKEARTAASPRPS